MEVDRVIYHQESLKFEPQARTKARQEVVVEVEVGNDTHM
eukprot:CAMPEP_0178951328 /NCGR_PEP_ID=MMETSP0789-20121207/7161_1 /TAXON_ID=3005 /ORGANISM="Rhizosolenia setigera, Strain CCMP 1694" /LENGTH=39 /DNA_ID= /DNA_START= /DNA_END= /DNA_ORIENTATION=